MGERGGVKIAKGSLAHLAGSGASIVVRVTPSVRHDAIAETATGVEARVTAPASEGRANAAVRKLLARALDVAPGRLTLVHGATARRKTFRLD